MSSSLEPEKIASIFNLYTKYRYITYNSIISSDIQIYKFKERLQNCNKIFGEMESKKYIPKEPESIQIVVKEGKDKKVYTQEIPLIQNNDEQKEEKKLEKKEEKKEKKSDEQKTFLVLGGYPDVVNAILKRGYKQIKNQEDKTVDFLYVLKNVDIPFQDLKNNQLVNHYWKANQLTRKSNLLKNLRNLYFKNICIDNFYPRAYELSDKNDLEDFIEDFKTNRAIVILKQTLECKGENVNKEEVITALNIIKRKLDFICNLNNDNIVKKFENLKNKPNLGNKENNNKNENDNTISNIITDKEWEIISNESMEIYFKEIFDLEKNKMLTIKPEREHLHKFSMKNKTNTKNKKVVTNTKNINKNKNINNTSNNNKKESFIKSEEDKKLEEEFKAQFKKQQEERDLERKKFEEEL